MITALAVTVAAVTGFVSGWYTRELVERRNTSGGDDG